MWRFTTFLMKTFASKPSSSAKNHQRCMLHIFKTSSELSAMCQKQNQGRPTRRSENIEANVKKP